ncbi:hypothetical protein [Campylobacter insulaenigrae]|uniref:Uncharacterized protein n=1 Tax=Campylobacter insulaenigrae NCTC 12927 TaxID=1031564 RepID=A0A0A8H2P9_9BACT|nr:hypothetical protein [Campylobacter insulaenigrae]AJC88257.1 hypothetical protein CINS_1301 [Campylobacter insulaenigrae NCTC 12927]
MKEVVKNLKNLVFDEKKLQFFTYGDYISAIALTSKIRLLTSSQMRSFDILRVILFRIYQKFQRQKGLFLYKPNDKCLKKINKKLYEFTLYFMIFENIFEFNIQKRIVEDLHALKAKFDLLKNTKANYKEISKILNSVEIKNFLFNLEFVLKDDSDFFQGQKDTNLQELLNFIIKKELISLRKSILKSSNNFKEFDKINFIFKYFSKTYKNIDKIDLLIKNEKMILNQNEKSLKNINKIIEKLDR